MDLDKLKQHQNILKPYNLWVASFSQYDTEYPVLIKVIHSDFKVEPTFTTARLDTGSYEITIDNYTDLNLSATNKFSVGGENIEASSALNRIETFLSIDHSIIYVKCIDIGFGSLSECNGSFNIFYYNYY